MVALALSWFELNWMAHEMEENIDHYLYEWMTILILWTDVPKERYQGLCFPLHHQFRELSLVHVHL